MGQGIRDERLHGLACHDRAFKMTGLADHVRPRKKRSLLLSEPRQAIPSPDSTGRAIALMAQVALDQADRCLDPVLFGQEAAQVA